MIPLKINIFVWRLLLNRVPTKDNLVRRQTLAQKDQYCSIGCGFVEDRDHLFVKRGFYGRIWFLVSSWLGFSTTTNVNLLDKLVQLDGLGVQKKC